MQGVGVVALIPGRGAKIHMPHGQNKQNRQQRSNVSNKFNKDFKNGPHQKTFFFKKVRSSEKPQDVLLCEGMSSVKRFQLDAVKGTPEMGRVFQKS